jgi:hypothetical protein
MTNISNKVLIAHRGNIHGPNLQQENHPTYISYALLKGYHVEVDVWLIDEKYVLGHDKPDYEVDKSFFYNDRLWVHCKNIEALFKLKTNKLINAFFHEQDDCTLTSQGYIWTYPKKLILTNQSIAVLPERVESWDLSQAYGICTDFPYNYLV